MLEKRYETDSYATEQWLLIENYNDFVVNAGNDEVIVNGISVSNAIFLTNNIGPHLKAKAAVIIKLSESEEKKISKIETVELYADFYNYDEGFEVKTEKLKIK